MQLLLPGVLFGNQPDLEAGQTRRRDRQKAAGAGREVLAGQAGKINEQGGEGMNIDKTNGSSFIQSYQKQMQVSPVERSKPIQKEDEVQISNRAKEMFEKNTGVDMDRQEKINALKLQIQSGEYEVNSSKVAESVFDFWYDK